VNSLQLQRDMIVVRKQHCNAGQRSEHNSKYQGAAWSVLVTRGDDSDERAHDQSCDQAADVGGVVDAGKREAEDEVVNNERAEAAKRA